MLTLEIIKTGGLIILTRQKDSLKRQFLIQIFVTFYEKPVENLTESPL